MSKIEPMLNSKQNFAKKAEKQNFVGLRELKDNLFIFDHQAID